MTVTQRTTIRKWLPEEIEFLKDNWSFPPNYKMFCEVLKRKQDHIYYKGKSLGLPVCNEYIAKYKNNLEDIKKEFLEQYKISRSKEKAYKISGLSRKKLESVLEYDKEFKSKYYDIANFINSTFRCYDCKKILPVEMARYKRRKSINNRKVNNCICIDCEKNKKHKDLLTLEGRLKRILRYVKDRNPETDIDYNYLIELYKRQNGECFYTGKKLEVNASRADFNLLSIDRKDSSITYYKDNVVLCCWAVNRMKSDIPFDEFIEVCGIVNNRFKNEPLL